MMGCMEAVLQDNVSRIIFGVRSYHTYGPIFILNSYISVLALSMTSHACTADLGFIYVSATDPSRCMRQPKPGC